MSPLRISAIVFLASILCVFTQALPSSNLPQNWSITHASGNSENSPTPALAPPSTKPHDLFDEAAHSIKQPPDEIEIEKVITENVEDASEDYEDSEAEEDEDVIEKERPNSMHLNISGKITLEDTAESPHEANQPSSNELQDDGSEEVESEESMDDDSDDIWSEVVWEDDENNPAILDSHDSGIAQPRNDASKNVQKQNGPSLLSSLHNFNSAELELDVEDGEMDEDEMETDELVDVLQTEPFPSDHSDADPFNESDPDLTSSQPDNLELPLSASLHININGDKENTESFTLKQLVINSENNKKLAATAGMMLLCGISIMWKILKKGKRMKIQRKLFHC